MLYIQTTRPLDDIFVNDVENYFYLKYKSIYKHIMTPKIIKEIDDAEIIYEGVIRTKFGVTDAVNLSSGTKALLIALTRPDCVVNFIEAGQNIFDKALELSSQYDIHMYVDNAIWFTENLDSMITVDDKMVKAFDFVCTQF